MRSQASSAMLVEQPPVAPAASWRRLRLPLAIAALAILVNLPALKEPLTADDDLVLRERLSAPQHRAPAHYGRTHIPSDSHLFANVVHDLYDWVGPSSVVTPTQLMVSGVYPWYANEELRLAFWRPLANITHWLDYQWWPENATAIHLHSILWYAAAAAAIAVLYRRLGGSARLAAAAAALAAALWAVDPWHSSATAWMAGRNVSLSIAFGALALAAHDAWRRGGSRRAAVLAPVLYALALLAGEPGVATAAYLAAYAAFLDAAPPRSRLLSLAPAAVVSVAWGLVYRAMDFGISGTQMYLDPGREPLHLAAAVVERAPPLLVGELGWPPAILYESVAPGIRGLYWAACVTALAVLLAFVWPLLRTSGTARFWGAGMVLAVVPVCAATPLSDRRLFFVGIGGMGLLALWVAGTLGGASWRPWKRIWRFTAYALAAGLLALHAASPLWQLARGFKYPPSAERYRHLAIGNDPALAEEELILVTAPNTFLTVYLPFDRALNGRPVPRSTRLLAPAFRTLEISRPGPSSLILRGVGGSLMTVEEQLRFDPGAEVYGLRWTNRAFWHDVFPVPEGSWRRLPGMEVEVLEMDAAGLPVVVRFDFDRPLEEPGRRWLAWSWETRQYVTVTPPPIGHLVRLPGPFAS